MTKVLLAQASRSEKIYWDSLIYALLITGKAMRSEKGFALIETLVALALLGIVASVFLGGIGTASHATIVADEQATAESLVRSEIEYVKNQTYQYYTTQYPVDPNLDIPSGWSMSPPAVVPVHASDDGLQKVTITVERNGEGIFSAYIYKGDR